jgi:hypothetical protein
MNSVITRYQAADRPGNTASDAWIVERIVAGWRPQAIAVAAGVSLRTAQRWRAEVIRVEELSVGGWVARFAVCRTRAPFRLEPWRRTC